MPLRLPPVNDYAVTFAEPARGPADSMPIGNGHIGANVWVEPGGDVLLYLARGDAWSQDARLLKLARLRVSLQPASSSTNAPPASPAPTFKQFLNLEKGRIEITVNDRSIWVWIDANAPIVRVEAQSESLMHMRVDLEIWRTEQRELTGHERHSAYGLAPPEVKIVEEPDTVLDAGEARLSWCHRNERSMWAASMKHQHLESLMAPKGTARDPLIHRTFGGLIGGEGFTRITPTQLQSAKPGKRHSIWCVSHAAQTETLGNWRGQLDAIATEALATDARTARAAHERWWRGFWNRSWIVATGDDEARLVTQSYTLQRYINACAGRGAFPIKFNGSLFTVDWGRVQWWGEKVEDCDADYRRWGGPYWFQNTRLPYWAMLPAGDFDMVPALFRMYREALPLAEARTRNYFNHGGAHFPETMHFWGAYADENYGFNRGDLPIGTTENQYIRWHLSGALELVALGLEYHDATGDDGFARELLLPLARPILRFYAEHYPRDEEGRLKIEPAQALETWWDVTNPSPDIAGLRRVLEALVPLRARRLTDDADVLAWDELAIVLPPLPVETVGGVQCLAQASQVRDQPHNMENPNLYAVFPFRIYGVGRPDLELARATYQHRFMKKTGGWMQDSIQAAALGLVDEARRDVVENCKKVFPGSRFPAFWGPNFDWVPDQDNGGVLMIALQHMAMQCAGQAIHVLPAWPKGWDVSFRLHASGGTVVECEARGGKIESLSINPAERRADVVTNWERA